MTAPGGGRGGPRPQGVPSAVRGAALIGLAVIAGIIGLQVLDDSSPGSGSTGPVIITAPTSDTSVTTTGGSTVTTGVKLKPKGQVKVKVYNASGVPGVAQAKTDALKAVGYNTLTPANLDKTRKGNVVQCRTGFENDGKYLALYPVGNGATAEAFPSSPPAGSGDADCLVIMGTAS